MLAFCWVQTFGEITLKKMFVQQENVVLRLSEQGRQQCMLCDLIAKNDKATTGYRCECNGMRP